MLQASLTAAASRPAQAKRPVQLGAGMLPGKEHLSPEDRDAMLEAIPHLRAFAISLTGRLPEADDLVQEALVRGLRCIDHFETGTSMQAWLFTILRNQFYTNCRKRRHEVEDPDGVMAASLSSAPEQHGRLDIQDLQWALNQLPGGQREALWLVAAEGYSYDEAARICGILVGTLKSRVNRARTRLAELLLTGEPDASAPEHDLGAHATINTPPPGRAV